ncbi:MAG: MFS transporter [Oscillospiraceae bacterium]|nr:MFS transporter [Oscillospiraceae bacterium]
MSVYRLFNRSYRDYVHDNETLRTLNIIILSVAVGMLLFSIQGGVAFVGYASALGAGEFAFGLISALPILAGLLQLFVSFLAVKTGKFKRMFLIGGIIQRISWIVIAFIPYILPVGESRLWLLIVLVTLAAMAGSFVHISHMTLMGSVIPIEVRGRYITARQKVCTAVSLVVGLGVAFTLDGMQGFLGYTIVFAIGGVAGLIDILMYAGIKFSIIPNKPEGFSLMQGMKACFTSPVTRNYLLFWMFWHFAINISAPFFNKYAIDRLELSYTSIIIFGQIVSQTLALAVISRWGVFLDKYGSVPMMTISATVSTLGGFVWLFAVPGSILPLFLFNFLGGLFWCANEACMVNMQLSHTPSTGRPAALAVYTVFTSVAAAIALICGGALLETLSPVMENLDFTFMGTPFDNYKLVFCIAAVLRFVVIGVFLPRVWNEKGMTLKESYSKVYNDAKARVEYEFSRLKLLKKTK